MVSMVVLGQVSVGGRSGGAVRPTRSVRSTRTVLPPFGSRVDSVKLEGQGSDPEGWETQTQRSGTRRRWPGEGGTPPLVPVGDRVSSREVFSTWPGGSGGTTTTTFCSGQDLGGDSIPLTPMPTVPKTTQGRPYLPILRTQNPPKKNPTPPTVKSAVCDGLVSDIFLQKPHLGSSIGP